MIDKLFSYESARIRHKSSPLLEEREAFLEHLHNLGTSMPQIRSTSAMLLHVIHLMNISNLRPIQADEVQEAAVRWCESQYPGRGKYTKSSTYFTTVAMRWFRFADVVSREATAKTEFEAILEDFKYHLTFELGYSALSISIQARRASEFLSWMKTKKQSFANIDLEDVENYLRQRRAIGLRPQSINSTCCALRTLFRYASLRGINSPKIAPKIANDSAPRYQSKPRGPEWKDVRRILDDGFGNAPSELRALAIVSLCAVYALRRIEVARLMLSDIDWIAETITVRRAKSRRVQKFPLQFEVGEKILKYLRHGRAKCACRNVFVTIRPPYKKIDPSITWKMVSTKLIQRGIQSENFGLHALRHSCATKLLQDGLSLKDIADFLGHSDMSSVSIYAKFDLKTLRAVAAFSLGGLR